MNILLKSVLVMNEMVESENVHDADVGHVPVREGLADTSAHVVAHVEAARPPIDVRVLKARLADGWRVDDAHHLLEVVGHQPVVERLVAALQTRQERVLAEIARLRAHEHQHCLCMHLRTLPTSAPADSSCRTRASPAARSCLLSEAAAHAGRARHAPAH